MFPIWFDVFIFFRWAGGRRYIVHILHLLSVYLTHLGACIRLFVNWVKIPSILKKEVNTTLFPMATGQWQNSWKNNVRTVLAVTNCGNYILSPYLMLQIIVSQFIYKFCYMSKCIFNVIQYSCLYYCYVLMNVFWCYWDCNIIFCICMKLNNNNWKQIYLSYSV